MAINRIRADIDLDAILYNMESMHNKLKPGTMMAMVMVLRLFQRYWSRFRICGAMPLLQATRQCSLSQQAEKSRYLF